MCYKSCRHQYVSLQVGDDKEKSSMAPRVCGFMPSCMDEQKLEIMIANAGDRIQNNITCH